MRSVLDFTTVIGRIATSTLPFALLGALAGPFGILIGAVVGGLIGCVHAYALIKAKCYPTGVKGWLLLVVDYTWSLPNTIIGSLYLAINFMLGNRLDLAQSRHRSSLVLSNGIFAGFATTLGPVEAGTNEHIADHEYVHVLQARIFGPLYIPLILLNYPIATILPYWWLYHDHVGHPITSFRDYFMKGVYPHIWHEEWAYKVQGHAP